MKMNYALAFGVFLTASLMAQTNSSSPGTTPAPAAATNSAPAAPEAKPAPKKPAATQPKIVEPTVNLMSGPAEVNARNVNVRGRSTIMGEVLTRLTKGDKVTVIEQVENKWAKGADPKQWARIAYPSNAPVWIFAAFVDANKTVTASRLNLRGGPGENYSIVGRIPKGTTVNEIATKGEWMQIAPPETATAFMAAMYLTQDAAMLAAAEPAKPAVEIEPASTNVITDVEPVIAEPVEVAAANPPEKTPSELEQFVSDVSGGADMEEPEAPLPPRIVMREGIVRNATSIQAPSHYGLAGLETGRTINYLYTSSTNLNLNRYANLHVIVTGEESLDERWPNTPVLTLQRIQVVDE